ncbi:hypothetical protein F2Q70_00021318 [Brassica cretica]|uniref:Uncharacterized protein n=1 Tax=Brassica cretica TaxID=69181 RepID=A0A8S9HN80_BRACR|nr:hypothetical protein F2Q70_00021318 [Brassica cretica]KAF2559539.1 hypothetical protein F2Q68_00014783 [Brassica cretica]
MVPWFADFVSSALPFMFFHLVAAFITARISGGSPFRYVCQSSLFVLFPSFPWYRDGSYLLVGGCAFADLGMCLSVSCDFSLPVIILPLACFLGLKV